MNDRPEKGKWTKARIRSVLAPVLVLAGLYATYDSHVDACPREYILGAWLIAPPVWFLLEYWLLFDREQEGIEWVRFKYHQQLYRNFWIGMAAFLAVLYLPIR